jgi:hypothetical protein
MDMFNAVGELFETDREAVLEIVEAGDRVGTATIERVDAYITEQSVPRWADKTFPWLWSVYRDVSEVWYNFFGVVAEKQIGGYEENLLSRGVLKFAEAVGETGRKQLRDLLNKAMAEGWPQEDTAERIYDLFWTWNKFGYIADEEAFMWVEDRLPRYRREMIARTELIRASNSAALMRFQSQGIAYKEWHVVDDDRLCPYCESMDGKRFTLLEPFARVGDTVTAGEGEDATTMKVDYMDVMGPPLHPHCRCTVLPWDPSWTEDDPVSIPSTEDLQAPPPETEPLDQPDIFPDDLPGRVEKVKDLGGSTGAVLVKDPKTGRKYVKKYGNSAEHIKAEALANQLYRSMGVNAPPLRLYEEGERPVMFSQFIEDARPLNEILREGGPAAAEAIRKLKDDFVADALLANWDVLGLNFDNILVDPSGKVWRIDNGGSLQFRAQGAKKPAFDMHPMEIWSLRDKGVNQQTARIFGDLDFLDIVRQIEELDTPAVNTILLEAEGGIPKIVRGRLRELERMQDYARKMNRDNFTWDYLDVFFRSDQVVRRNLVMDFPDYLEKGSRNDYKLEDPYGQQFDNLRGDNSIMDKFYRVLRENGGNKGLVTGWASQQASSSWSSDALAMKYWIAEKARSTDPDDYYWQRGGIEKAKAAYERLTGAGSFGSQEEEYTRTMSMLHALNFEFLHNVDLPGNQPHNDVIRLARTVDRGFTSHYGMEEGEVRKVTAAPYSSTSITNLAAIAGNEVLMYEVPHWRIIGNYMFERGDYNSTFFYGDRENELTAILQGLELFYQGNVRDNTYIPSLDWW